MDKKAASLIANIDAILNGTPEERENLAKHHFYLAETPAELKDKGLKGDFFDISYGAIARHNGKDDDHNLKKGDWIELSNKIAKPFAVATYKNTGYRLFIDLKVNGKWTVAGIEVRNIGKNRNINAVTTVFGRKNATTDTLFWKSPEITPDQEAFLNGHNSHQYPLGQSIVPLLSPPFPQMSRPL
ncbi:MAG: hypothetical protein LBT00_02770 [Spirochaetaceae bacterium]|jgi:hypothetical protein|nr:hypothetical protein [Spirochaetaceae bacterium]